MARGVPTLVPTIPMVSFRATTTTSTPASPATTTPPGCLDTPSLQSPILARGRLNQQLNPPLMLRPMPTMVTMAMAAGTATDMAIVDITVTVMALAMVMVTTAKRGDTKD